MQYFTRFATQLRLATLGPLLLVTCLFAYFYVHEAVKFQRNQRIHTAETYIKQLLPVTQISMQHHDVSMLRELVHAATIHPDLKALSIFDPQGQPLTYYGIPLVLPHILLKHPTLPFLKTIHHITYAPIIPSGHNTPALGWIAIQLDTHSENITFYRYTCIAIMIGILGLIIALLIQALLTQNILLPLARLRRSMKQILRNEFKTEIKVASKGLLGDIEVGCLHLQKQYLDATHDIAYQIEVATADLQQSLELLEEKNIQLSLEKKKTEEYIQQQSTFIANMGHEIKTPMNGIMGFANILLDSPLSALQKDYIHTMKNATQDLLNLINDILDYSKIEAGKLLIESIPIHLRYLLDEMIALITPLIHQKQLDIFTYIPAEVPQVIQGDPLRIKQILNNLLINAIKFTEKGHILIEIFVLQDHPSHYDLCFKIIDTGIGISKEEQTYLFNAFYQTNTGILKHYHGTGLGLAICKKLTEAMHGSISIESYPQAGSTVTVHLPLKKLLIYEQDKAQTQSQSFPEVLYIDTHALSTRVFTQMLTFLHYTPYSVTELSDIPSVIAAHPHIQLCIIHVTTLPAIFDCSILSPKPCLYITHHANDPRIPHHALRLLKPLQTQKFEQALFTLLNPTITHETTQNQLVILRSALKKASIKLLIAEDNTVNRLLFHTLLSPYCTIDTAQDGEEAIQYCLAQQYDVVLLDLKMPKRTGQEVAHVLRQNITYQHTPILFISAHAADIDTETLQTLSIRKCLQKPIDEETLIREILALLATSTMTIDWERLLKNLSYNYQLALNCLTQFEHDLKEHRILLQNAFTQKDREKLSNIAHTVKGACSFLVISQLKMYLDKLETTAQHASFKKLYPLMQLILKEIDTVLIELPHKITALQSEQCK